MRRSASQIIRNLENRVARLERQAKKFKRTWDKDEYPPLEVREELAKMLARDLKRAGVRFEPILHRGKVPSHRFMKILDAEKFLLDYLKDNVHASNAESIYKSDNPNKMLLISLYGLDIELENYQSSRDEITLGFYMDDYSSHEPVWW